MTHYRRTPIGLGRAVLIGIAGAPHEATAQKALTKPGIVCGHIPSIVKLPLGTQLLGLINNGSSTVPEGTVVTYSVQVPDKRPVTSTTSLRTLRPGDSDSIGPYPGTATCSVDSVAAGR